MTKLSVFIRYVKVHAPFGAKIDQIDKERLISHIDDAVQEAARILIEEREPWMLTTWDFDVVADQKAYKLSSIAPTGLLGTIANFARPHSLHILDESGYEWRPFRIVHKIEGMELAMPLSNQIAPIAEFQLIPGSGDMEGEYQINMANPPDYSSTAGGKFSFFALPDPIASIASVNYEPAIPKYADRFVKMTALRSVLFAHEQSEAWLALEGEQQRREIELRGGAGGNISDTPEYVHDVEQAEEDRLRLEY